MSGNTMPVLWYENEGGDKWMPPAYFGGDGVPDGFVYQHYRNPFELRTNICTTEGPIGSMGSTYPGDLALALCRPTLRQRVVQICRYGWPAGTMPLDAAILRAASCERCMNIQAHRVGLSWGYRAGSPEDTAHTSCEHCE